MAVTLDNPDALFLPKDVAEFRHKTEGSLAQERFAGTGPRFIRDGRRVLYRASDLAEYLAANTVTPQRTDP
ncbi:hypothetical protein [Mycobacterium sp. AT1]|uniref:hypothetical protein n=1 Tax=Mycobacterium sp. AT1 TaxID=1961706 RepID=UPI0009AD6298|nr:hypothetical protein [Mycobacterium sp. AT1]OPX12490.1 hypothetical protein B1790_03310 [Mycobacterium sp. AT1]